MAILLRLIPLIIKNLPIILGVLTGVTKFVSSFNSTGKTQIDEQSLAELIEEITEREISRIVNENKSRIRRKIPSDEQRQRTERLDELMEQFEKEIEEYNRKKNPDS